MNSHTHNLLPDKLILLCPPCFVLVSNSKDSVLNNLLFPPGISRNEIFKNSSEDCRVFPIVFLSEPLASCLVFMFTAPRVLEEKLPLLITHSANPCSTPQLPVFRHDLSCHLT